jgi:hypothetical protein
MPFLIAFVAAAWVGLVIYRFLPVPAEVDAERLARVMEWQEEIPETLPFWRAMLLPFNQLATRLPPQIIGRTDVQLYWAQFQGQWIGWTPVEWWGLRIALMLVGVLVGMYAGGGDPLIGFGVPLLIYLYLGSKLSTPSEKAMRQLQRELPEVAQTLALLMNVGKDESSALELAAQGKGLVHRWIRYVLATRPLDVPLLRERRTAGTARGHFLEAAQKSGVPALVNFATQFEFLKTAGTGEGLLMGTLADTVAADYEAQVMARAEALENKLVLPVALFFFIPYMAGLLIPMFATAGQ